MKNRKFVVAACLLSILCVQSAFAARQWYFQRIADSYGNPIGSDNTAIAMRSGYTWPVVVTNTATAAMVPGGWVRTTGGLGQLYLDAATSNNGQSMVFASGEGNVLTFDASGWNRSTLGTPSWKSSVAFTQDNKPAVLTRGSNGLTLSVRSSGQWSSETFNVETDSFALDYDSYNQANMVYSQGSSFIYATKGVFTDNTWNFSQPVFDLPLVSGPLDLALNSNDTPFVLYRSNSYQLVCATYSQQQGQWISSIINEWADYNYCITADSQGGIGIAYVTNLGNIGFNYLNGADSWSTESIWTMANMTSLPPLHSGLSIGLTFDAQSNPVISFNAGGEVWIAYDPVMIPEPATMLLLLGGAVVLRHRKSR